MGPVEVGIGIDHLRLEPETELHAQCFDLFRQPFDTAGQNVAVGVPVAQARVVAAPCAEPAVIQDEQFHAAVPGFGSDLQQLFLIEIKIRSFPVVAQDGPGPVSPIAPGQSAPVKIMVDPAHAAQAPVCPDHDRFGRLERFPSLQFPGEAIRMDAHHNADCLITVFFRPCQEVTAVDQGESHDLSLLFIRSGAFEDDKRILLVRRMAPQALDGDSAGRQRPGHGMTFPGPGTGQLDPFIFRIRQVQAHTHGPLQDQRFCSFIVEEGAPGNNTFRRKDGIIQDQLQTGHSVLQEQLQGHRFPVIFCINGRKSFQLRLALHDLIGPVAEAADSAAVFMPYHDSRLPEISVSEDAVLHPQVFGG